MSLAISHDWEDGTTLSGDPRPHQEVLKRNGWRWARRGRFWYVPRSRDRDADRGRIDRTVAELREVGFDVTVEVDDTDRSLSDRWADEERRAEERAARLEDRAERKRSEADAASGKAREILDVIPPGQPVLVGHHSERRHRRDLDRVDRNLGRSVEASREADRLDRRARSAARTTNRRRDAAYLGNRLREAEADARRWRREEQAASGAYRERCAREAERRERDAAEIRGMLAELEDAGVRMWGPDDFEKGDRVRVKGSEGEVVRVNRKTLTVAPSAAPMLRIRYAYTEVRGKL